VFVKISYQWARNNTSKRWGKKEEQNKQEMEQKKGGTMHDKSNPGRLELGSQ